MENKFQTPGSRKTSNKVSFKRSSEIGKSITIPASPAMKKLGFGTGVKVFLMERYSPRRGTYGSPWAIKKIDSKLKRPLPVALSNTPKRQKTTASGGASSPVLYRQISTVEMCNSRLSKEADLLRSFKHANIIGFRTYTTSVDGTKCLAMETGERDLFSILEQRCDNVLGPLPADQCLKVCQGVSSGLEYLHNSHHILHGDIKAANVLINGPCRQVKLCDFGVCLKLDDKMVAGGGQCYIGTECWSPPEAIKEDRPITDRADIYAFGLVIWECLCVSIPHVALLSMDEGEELLSEAEQAKLCEQRDEIFYQQLGTRPPLLPCAASLKGLYLPLLEAFYHCTSTDPKERPSSTQLVTLFGDISENEAASTNKEEASEDEIPGPVPSTPVNNRNPPVFDLDSSSMSNSTIFLDDSTINLSSDTSGLGGSLDDSLTQCSKEVKDAQHSSLKSGLGGSLDDSLTQCSKEV